MTAAKIALFQCRWCLFSPADQEWVDTKLPENIHSQNALHWQDQPTLSVNAVQGGADGIMISGCLPEQCHLKQETLPPDDNWRNSTIFSTYLAMKKSVSAFCGSICRIAASSEKIGGL